jgi:hypothetical protein
MIKHYASFEHHGKTVFSVCGLRGKHRKYCLCFQCSKFKPDKRDENCAIANDVYNLCIAHNLTTPVFECPEFNPIQGKDGYMIWTISSIQETK